MRGPTSTVIDRRVEPVLRRIDAEAEALEASPPSEHGWPWPTESGRKAGKPARSKKRRGGRRCRDPRRTEMLDPTPIGFRPLRAVDFPLLQRWLNLPHVLRWWKEPL